MKTKASQEGLSQLLSATYGSLFLLKQDFVCFPISMIKINEFNL